MANMASMANEDTGVTPEQVSAWDAITSRYEGEVSAHLAAAQSRTTEQVKAMDTAIVDRDLEALKVASKKGGAEYVKALIGALKFAGNLYLKSQSGGLVG